MLDIVLPLEVEAHLATPAVRDFQVPLPTKKQSAASHGARRKFLQLLSDAQLAAELALPPTPQ